MLLQSKKSLQHCWKLVRAASLNEPNPLQLLAARRQKQKIDIYCLHHQPLGQQNGRQQSCKILSHKQTTATPLF